MSTPRPPKTMTAADFQRASEAARKAGMTSGEAAESLRATLEILRRQQTMIEKQLAANTTGIRKLAPPIARMARARRSALPWWRLIQRARLTRQIRRMERIDPSDGIA